MTRQGHSASWESCKICLCIRHKKSCLGVRQTAVSSKLNVLNLLKYVLGNFET